jgi:putative exosortase-associated protein (TIGR04073 family)
MKLLRMICALLLCGLLAGNSARRYAFAGLSDYFDDSFHKLGRGAHDVIFCVGEVPYRVSQTYGADGVYGAATSGLLVGLGRTVMRATVGVFEVSTFFIPQSPILDPEFFFNELK